MVFNHMRTLTTISVRLLILTIGCVLAHQAAFAQSQLRFRVAGGLSTPWITNDNPATYRIAGNGDPTDSTAGFGGGLDGMQIGWGLKGFADLDKQKVYRIPFGFDFWSMSGTQTIQGNRFEISVRHDVEMYSGHMGFEWSFVEFPLAYARAYVGAEARLTHVGPNSIRTYEEYRSTDPPTIRDNTVSRKEAATRIGGMVRLGIEGELYYPVFLNTSVGWGVINLFGRDTRPTWEGGRGELLTAVGLNESGESYVHMLNFTFMIQVRI